MQSFNSDFFKKLYTPPFDSHKGQNGKLLVIGGSHLFHAASIWALQIASKMLDMVFYSSVPENNQIIQNAKEEFRNGIVIKRADLESYVEEADCILIGPGLPRVEGKQADDDDTQELTERLLKKFSHKKWVVDGGSLQVIDPACLLLLQEMPILTPHHKEFETLKFKVQNSKFKIAHSKYSGQAGKNLKIEEQVSLFAREYNCIVLYKGVADIVCSTTECMKIPGGNAGMTKGGTGDVLAGLVASLYCKNDAYLSAICASAINKKAGESLFEKVGFTFNASDLVEEIPRVMATIQR